MRLSSYMPPREYVLAEVARGALLWLLVRLVITGMAAAVSPPSAHFMSLPPVIAAAVVALVATLARVDSRIMREQVFYANLGVPSVLTPGLAAVTAITLELSVAIIT
jgi:hypothetical protein